uniref:Uncharacterized protein n=1 Tax=viral metagenome TaxID=1070528 RepID=A0A6C0IPJ8_9ZZZZ
MILYVKMYPINEKENMPKKQNVSSIYFICLI